MPSRPFIQRLFAPHPPARRRAAFTAQSAEILEERLLLSAVREAVQIPVESPAGDPIIGQVIDQEVYLPFSFLQNRYDAQGHVAGGRFEFRHSDIPLRDVGDYRPNGSYLDFDQTHVEGTAGSFDGQNVPLKHDGYHDPRSIATYALSHHSQYSKVGSDPGIALDIRPSLWESYMDDGSVQMDSSGQVLLRGGINAGHRLRLNIPAEQAKYVSLDYRSDSRDFQLYLGVQTSKGYRYLQYSPGEGVQQFDESYFFYGIPRDQVLVGQFRSFLRNVAVDVQKIDPDADVISIDSLYARGDLTIRNLRIRQTAHLDIVLQTADWFLGHQDARGGWANDFDSQPFPGRTETIPAGWYSAAGQGMAMSVLTRAYELTNAGVYLDSARRAMELYTVHVAFGGVLNTVLDGRPIYEEFPTNPGSHVLSGFLNSLIGLYDVKETFPAGEGQREAVRLYNDGMATLKAILPMYDLGNRSAHDLTHVTSGHAPNVADWHHHATHIHQLRLLMSLDHSPILRQFHDRWIDYSNGYRARTNGTLPNDRILVSDTFTTGRPTLPAETLKLRINGNASEYQAYQIAGMTYLPFHFVQQHYEAYGDLQNGAFRFRHFNGILRDVADYSPAGNYLNFDRISVENWANVFDGQNVPVNRFRWGDHYYPISIAHFALSHYSQHLKSGSDPGIALDIHPDRWESYLDPGTVRVDAAGQVRLRGGIHAGHRLRLNLTPDQAKYVSMDYRSEDGNFRIYLGVQTSKGYRYLQYSPGNGVRQLNENYFFYGIPPEQVQTGRFQSFLRNVALDIQKVDPEAELISIDSLYARGDLAIRNLRTRQNAHLDIVLQTADWFLGHQDARGGWASNFDHQFFAGRTEVMPAGWYSAMAQGMAMSVLTRAYHLTGAGVYLDSARRAMELFTVHVAHGGILNTVLDGRPIYEEYPTNPGSYVLNGFIFALIGIYDAKETFPAGEGQREAVRLYDHGMATLKAILPLYDLGNRSAYDLTHLTAGNAPNVARWGYHATHIHQLKLFMSIDDDPIFRQFHDRWVNYTNGYRVPPL